MRASTLVVPEADHVSAVTPVPVPSHTLIGFGLAVIEPVALLFFSMARVGVSVFTCVLAG